MVEGTFARSTATQLEQAPPTSARRCYDILKVSPTASSEEILKAWRKQVASLLIPLAIGIGDLDALEVINMAYEVLSDPQRRLRYDEGEEPRDLYDYTYGDGAVGGHSIPRRHRRTRDIVRDLSLPLEDFYLGRPSAISITRDVICTECHGAGGEDSTIQPCSACKTEGTTVTVRDRQRVHLICRVCSGAGLLPIMRKQCPKCKGNKVIPTSVVLRVRVEKGMKNPKRFTFCGEGNQSPGVNTGDVVVIVEHDPHPIFERLDDDLYMTVEIDLLTSLVGGTIAIRHLDNRVLSFALAGGEVTKSGVLKIIRNKGMPKHRNTGFGDLFVRFLVKFPVDIDDRSVQLLKDALGSTKLSSTIEEGDQIEEVALTEPDGVQEVPECNHQ